jgi:hypothetical protein
MTGNEDYIDLCYDHYKDTFEQIKGYIKRRNTCTVIILSLIVFLSIQTSNPELAKSISTEIVNKSIGNIQIDFEYIKTILYVALLWILTTYYRTIITIEKHYCYLHEIEEQLSNSMTSFKIEREGKNYLSHYPWLLTVVDILYSILFPVSIILLSIFKWINEKKTLNICDWNFWINSTILVCIVIVSLLYILLHFNDFKKQK